MRASQRAVTAHAHHHQPDPQDTLGQVLSAVCMVHCVTTPLVIGLLPAAASVLGGFHPVLLVGVSAVAVWAFVPGYRRHRSPQPALLALAGIGLLAAATLLFHGQVWDAVFSVAGATVMMAAHWRNRVLQRACCTHG